jgi:hypothetical protein
MATTPSIPDLTPDVAADDDALDAALDRLLRHEPRQRAYARGIVRAQEALRPRMSPEAWDLYLILDLRVSARLADALRVAARWAFAQGRRHAVPSHT